MQTVSFDLLSLLKRVKDNRYQIPQFQRPFIWRESQVKLLIDSIARNYPVGSLLVLNRGSEITLQSRNIEAIIAFDENEEDIFEEDSSSSEVQYILDGQQRITSITRVFLNSNQQKTYYFDLKKMLESFATENSNWIVSRTKSEGESKERLTGNRYIRSDIALDQVKSDIYISEYIEDSDDFAEIEKSERRKIAAKVKGYFETIRKYQVPVTILDSSSGLESICRVFETINSTGTRLTTYDLAVARFYPNPDLHQMFKESQEKSQILEEFEVEGERVLQTLYLINAHDENKFPEPTRSALLNLKSASIESSWTRAADGLAKAFTWAKENGARPEIIVNSSALVSLGAFFAVRPNAISDLSLNLNANLKRWFYSRILAQGARAAGNYRMAVDFMNLIEFSDGKAQIDIVPVKINRETIIKTSRLSDNRFKAILCLMAMYAKDDLLTGQPLDGDIQYHHIFPRSFSKNKGIKNYKIESVVNRIAVSRKTNSKLSDKSPENYIADIIKRVIADGTLDDFQARLKELNLPIFSNQQDYIFQFNPDNIDIFLEGRADTIMARIRSLLGNHVIEDDVEEEE